MYALAFIIAGLLVGIVCKIIKDYIRDYEDYIYGDRDDDNHDQSDKNK